MSETLVQKPIFGPKEQIIPVPVSSKISIAHYLLDQLIKLLNKTQ